MLFLHPNHEKCSQKIIHAWQPALELAVSCIAGSRAWCARSCGARCTLPQTWLALLKKKNGKLTPFVQFENTQRNSVWQSRSPSPGGEGRLTKTARLFLRQKKASVHEFEMRILKDELSPKHLSKTYRFA